jgi:hypothetical protein
LLATGTPKLLGIQYSAVGENFMSNKLQVKQHILMFSGNAILQILIHSHILLWSRFTVDIIFLCGPGGFGVLFG